MGCDNVFRSVIVGPVKVPQLSDQQVGLSCDMFHNQPLYLKLIVASNPLQVVCKMVVTERRGNRSRDMVNSPVNHMRDRFPIGGSIK